FIVTMLSQQAAVSAGMGEPEPPPAVPPEPAVPPVVPPEPAVPPVVPPEPAVPPVVPPVNPPEPIVLPPVLKPPPGVNREGSSSSAAHAAEAATARSRATPVRHRKRGALASARRARKAPFAVVTSAANLPSFPAQA